MRDAGFKAKVLSVLLGVVLGCTCITETVYAGYNTDTELFVRRYCLWVNGKVSGIKTAMTALTNLITELNNIRIGLGEIGVSANIPNCIPSLDFGANLNISGLNGLASCFSGLNVGVTMPDMSGLADCLTGMIPSLDISLPDFDADGLLSCLQQADFNLDLEGLTSNLGAILSDIMALLDALKSIKASLSLKFDTNFYLAIKGLATMCKEAGLKSSKRTYS
jgi:hypothetical protein